MKKIYRLILIYLALVNFQFVTDGWSNEGNKSLNTKKRLIFKVAALQSPPFTFLDNNKKLVEGVDYRIMELLKERLHFNYEVVTPSDGSFGNKKSNGSWNGIVKMIMQQEVDIGLTLMINFDRFQVVKYLNPFRFYKLKFVVHYPRPLDKVSAIFKPFQIWVWNGILISFFLTGIFCYMVTNHFETNRHSISKVYWLLFNILMAKGGFKRVKGTSSQILIVFWSLFAMIVISAYSGTLMAFMVNNGYEIIPRTFDELALFVKNGKYTCGTRTGSAFTHFLLNYKQSDALVIADHINRNLNKMSNNFVEGLDKALNHNYGYIAEEPGMRTTAITINEALFVFSKDSLVMFAGTFGVRRNFPLRKKFNRITSRLFEAGIINQFERDINEKIRHGSISKLIPEEVFKPVTLYDLLGIIILLGSGYIFASLCLIFEICIFHRKVYV